ncbi:MAG: hypothetical protein Q8M16_09140, partial [Pirellulaceae bacterium]|nr:hypothetical protein [Pirellulaceae bacterium]
FRKSWRLSLQLFRPKVLATFAKIILAESLGDFRYTYSCGNVLATWFLQQAIPNDHEVTDDTHVSIMDQRSLLHSGAGTSVH